MRRAKGGFEFMERPRDAYWAGLEERLGKGGLSQVGLTREQLAQCRELGILADRDEHGILLQERTEKHASPPPPPPPYATPPLMISPPPSLSDLHQACG